MGDLVIRHRTPCAECPWRKSSPRGWLGGHGVQAFAMPVKSGIPVPCHMASKNADTMCAGAAITMQNSCTSPRDRHDASEVDKVGRSDAVFNWVHDFVAHHDTEFLSMATKPKGAKDPKKPPRKASTPGHMFAATKSTRHKKRPITLPTINLNKDDDK